MTVRQARQVRSRRRRLGLSQLAVARHIGCSQPYISQLEAGQIHRPSHDVVRDLAAALRCAPADLFPAPKRRSQAAA